MPSKYRVQKEFTADISVAGTGYIYRIVGFDDFRCNYHSIVFYHDGTLIAAFSRKICDVKNLRLTIKDANSPIIMSNYGANMSKIKITATGNIEYADMEGKTHTDKI